MPTMPAPVNRPLLSTVNVGIAVDDPYEPAVTPVLVNVVEKDPDPDPVISPDKVVVALAAITSVPMVNPKFALAPAAVLAPVPPFATRTVPDNVDAAVEIVISALPSNATPLIFLGAANFVAVAELPVVF